MEEEKDKKIKEVWKLGKNFFSINTKNDAKGNKEFMVVNLVNLGERRLRV